MCTWHDKQLKFNVSQRITELKINQKNKHVPTFIERVPCIEPMSRN